MEETKVGQTEEKMPRTASEGKDGGISRRKEKCWERGERQPERHYLFAKDVGAKEKRQTSPKIQKKKK